MENFIIYMAKASGLLALFFLAYHILLRKETFFNTNRKYLLAGLFTSAILPLLVLTRTVWVEAAPAAQPMQEIDIAQLVMIQQAAVQQQQETNINWYDVAGGIYLAGVLLFLTRFMFDLLSLRRILKRHKYIKDDRYHFIDSEKIQTPFSFFNYIVYNSNALKPEELESIICHEKVHSSQRHSLDMIISQLFCIAFWFNPFVWMYRKCISQNLEFIADAVATKQIEDKQAYQKTLLKITVQPDCISITNHFYQSLIKKRIVMLNKKQSKRRNSWKYAAVLPLLAAFMLLFQLKVVAQEKEPPAPATEGTVVSEKLKIAMEITKDTKDSELEAEKKIFKDNFDADVTFSNVTRNSSSEITAIKVAVKDKTQSKVYEVSGTEPISPFTIEIEKDNSGKSRIAFGSPRNMRLAPAVAYAIDADTIMYSHNAPGAVYRIQGTGVHAIPAPPAPPAPIAIAGMPEGHWSVNSLKIGNDDMLVVINGKKQEKGEAIRLPLDEEVAEVKILKSKEAKKKYGREARKGAVEITTKRTMAAPNVIYGNARIMERQQMEDMAQQARKLSDMSAEMRLRNSLGNDGVRRAIHDRIRSMRNGEAVEADDAINPEVWASINKLTEEMWPPAEEGNVYKLRSGIDGSDMAKAREEIEVARKEMEQVRKELEEARKELAKSRSELRKRNQ